MNLDFSQVHVGFSKRGILALGGLASDTLQVACFENTLLPQGSVLTADILWDIVNIIRHRFPPPRLLRNRGLPLAPSWAPLLVQVHPHQNRCEVKAVIGEVVQQTSRITKVSFDANRLDFCIRHATVEVSVHLVRPLEQEPNTDHNDKEIRDHATGCRCRWKVGGSPSTMASMPKTGMDRMMVSCRRLSFRASKWSEYTVETPFRARW